MSELSGVTVQDIRDAAFGFTIPTGPAIDSAISRLIDKAELKIAARIPRLAERVASGQIPRASLALVVEDMVLRVCRNPESKKTETVDDYTYAIDASVASGRLYLSDDELRDLFPPSRGRVFGSIRIGVPSWRLPR